MSADADTEWLKWRQAGVTASDVANAATGSYGGIVAVIDSKRTEPEPTPPTEAQQRGHTIEPVLIHIAESMLGGTAEQQQVWMQHPERPSHRCTPDAIIPDGDGIVIEAKTRLEMLPPLWPRWELQVQWQLWVSGIDRALIIVGWVSESGVLTGLSTRWVGFSPDAVARLVEIADLIEHHVKEGGYPSPEDLELTGQAAVDLVTARHRKATKSEQPVDLTPYQALLDRWVELKAEETRVSNELASIRATVCAALGSETSGQAPGVSVSWSLPADTLDAAEALKAHPEIGVTVVDLDRAKQLGVNLKPFRHRTGARSFRVTQKKVNQ